MEYHRSMDDAKTQAYEMMYNKTFYYNDYSKRMYETMHFENHREALMHHLVDIRMLLYNRAIGLPTTNNRGHLQFIESVLIDSLPVRFAVANKKDMVLKYAKRYNIGTSYAMNLYNKLMDILSEKIGLGTLVFTGWFNRNSVNASYHIVLSEII